MLLSGTRAQVIQPARTVIPSTIVAGGQSTQQMKITIPAQSATQIVSTGAVFIKLLRKISYLSENFKFIFLYFYLYNFNETLHAYEKHCFS